MKSLLDKMFPSSIDAITPMIRREREMYREEKDKADRRLALLRRVYEEDCYPCLFCGNGKDAGHADGCELAEEIGG